MAESQQRQIASRVCLCALLNTLKVHPGYREQSSLC
jgi:hypothetical protein